MPGHSAFNFSGKSLSRISGAIFTANGVVGEAFSYAFFDADFIDGAIRLGQRDGARLIGLDGMPVWHEQAGGDAPVR